MPQNNQLKSFIFFSQTGCLLPILIIFNLFFGLIFFRPVLWLSIEVILILLFMLNSFILTRKIISSNKRKDAIDVEGEVIEERKRLQQ